MHSWTAPMYRTCGSRRNNRGSHATRVIPDCADAGVGVRCCTRKTDTSARSVIRRRTTVRHSGRSRSSASNTSVQSPRASARDTLRAAAKSSVQAVANHPSAESFRNGDRPICGAGIHHDDFVYDLPYALQTFRKPSGLVPHDHAQ